MRSSTAVAPRGASRIEHEDIEAIVRGIAPVFRELAERSVQSLRTDFLGVCAKFEAACERIAALERQVAELSVAHAERAAEAITADRVVDIFSEQFAQLSVVPQGDLEAAVARSVDEKVGVAVRDEVAKIPQPRDGKDGKDGVSVVDAFLTYEGHIALTTSLCEVKTLGRVVGRDGKDPDPVMIREMVHEEVKNQIPDLIKVRVAEEVLALPPAAPGIDGKDGKDVDQDHVNQFLADAVKAHVDNIRSEFAEFGDTFVDKAAAKVDTYCKENLISDLVDHIDMKFAQLPIPEKGEKGDKGDAGDSVDISEISVLITEAVKALPSAPVGPPGPPGPQGEPGRDADPLPLEEIRAAALEEAAAVAKRAVEALPSAPAGPPGPQGEPGRDAEPLPVAEIRAAALEEAAAVAALEAKRAVEALPKPVDGRTPTPDELTELMKQVVLMIPRRVKSLIDRDGVLHEFMSDGTSHEVGPVVGKDGKDVDMAVLTVQISDLIKETAEKWKPRDGVDGFGFDDIICEHLGGRNFVIKFVQGDREKRFDFIISGIPLDKGIYREDHDPPYQAGDGVVYGGSYWIAQRDAPGVPGRGEDNGWRLSAKAGREGKPGKDLEDRVEKMEKAMLALHRQFKEKS